VVITEAKTVLKKDISLLLTLSRKTKNYFFNILAKIIFHDKA